MEVVDLRKRLDHGADLVVGVGLNGPVELSRHVWACGGSVFIFF